MAETDAGMYRDNILDHYKHPHNKGVMAAADVTHRENNPLCGDEIEVFLKVENGTITEIKFEGQGCAISTAAGSMLTDYIKGKKLEDVAKLDKEDVFKLLGVPVSPARVKCALLALKAVNMAASSYLRKRAGSGHWEAGG